MKTQKSIFNRTFAYVLLMSVIFYGCSQSSKSKTIDGTYKIRIIDGCEYIEYDNGVFDQRVYTLTHKGNCKFCIERNKK